MLRPERMSKVSITGTKAVMPTVIETIHDLNLVHLSDYDGSWSGFENGHPIEGAEDASEQLVTIRSLERTLDLETDTPPPRMDLDEETLRTRLEEAREAITSVEDERAAKEDEHREITDRIERLRPFATLGIDLDLLQDYEFLEVAVGHGNADRIEETLEAAEEVETFELFTAEDVVAVFATPTEGSEDPIQSALVGAEFSTLEIPEGSGDPTEEIRALQNERGKLESAIQSLEADLDGLRHEYGDFLRAAEFQLSVEVDQAEAPLRFATSEHAFVAEGWIPANEYDRLVAALEDAVGDSVEVEHLRTASYGEHEHPHDEEAAEADAVATDGGESVTMDEEPPVVLSNPAVASPFELLTGMVNRPKYGEIDPTLAVFITFPIAFGFMIGDIGYGLLYVLMGWFLLRFDSPGMQALGTIGVWCGAFTMLFGWLYDDTFGVHIHYFEAGFIDYFDMLGLGLLSKGIQSPNWMMTWILVSLFFGWFHLNLGLIIRFVNELAHGWKTAVFEAGSWLLAMNGFLLWLFSHRDAGSLGLGTDLAASGAKPAEFFGAESVISHTGFVGFPEAIGILGLAALVVGIVMVGIAEGAAGLAESPAWVLGHFLSYLRVVAVLLGKGAMAFVVNLIVFGAYVGEDGYVAQSIPFGYDLPAAAHVAGVEEIEVAFAGLWHLDPAVLMIPIAILIFLLGHFIVLILGITAAGIQMLRLEYVEFFQKFFEGGGRQFVPFGRSAEPATD